MLDPITFADETKLFYTYSDIEKIFSTIDEELASINQAFTSNKLLLNATYCQLS